MMTFWFICVYLRTRRSFYLCIRTFLPASHQHWWEVSKHDWRVLIVILSLNQLEISSEVKILLCKVVYMRMVRDKIGPKRAYCLYNEWEQNVSQQHCLYVWWLGRNVTGKDWTLSVIKSYLSLSVRLWKNWTLFTAEMYVSRQKYWSFLCK